jgi:lysine decarboxylase
MSESIDQERAPLWETVTAYVRSGTYGMHTPAHKGGRFAPPELSELFAAGGLAHDLPAMTATDNTFHPTGCVREAQRLAAELFGARASFFLSAGSTLGVAAALLASVRPGETVALPRNIHRSVVAALVLTGALPRFIPHETLPECGALGVSPAALTAALAASPRPTAVLITRPSYYGLARELDEISAICRSRRVPLIVDEAHGAHLHFMPPGGPAPALAGGADLVVQSTHKTLGSLTGSAMLHVGRDSPVRPEQVQDALNFLQTTSPSYLLLASLDLARRWLWREGRRLFAKAVADAGRFEDEIDRLSGLRVLRPEREPLLAGHRRDPLRVVVNVSGAGCTGFEVERFLRTKFRVEDEMADWFNVVYVLSPNDDPAARERLLAGLRAVGAGELEAQGGERTAPAAARRAASMQHTAPILALAPREAALGPKSTVSFAEAAGRISAEMVMFYPPGIPLLMPGELVNQDVIEQCRELSAAGAHPYASDPSLSTIRVVKKD